MKDYKTLFGIRAIGNGEPLDGLETELDPCDWYDFEFGQDKSGYIFGVETMIGFESKQSCHNYLEDILESFTNWMIRHEYNTEQELNLWDVFTDGININTHFKDIETAYAALKFFIRGFEGNGLTYGQVIQEGEK